MYLETQRIMIFTIIFIILTGPSSGTRYENYSDGFSRENYVDDYIKSLDTGHLFFDPNQNMKVGITEDVYASITRNKSIILFEGIEAEEILANGQMKVNLMGKSFEIISKNPSDEQAVSSEYVTTWGWQVTPLESGEKNLTLTISVLIPIPNDGEKHWDKICEKTIKVQVNPAYSAKTFISNHVEFILGGLTTFLLGRVYRKYKH